MFTLWVCFACIDNYVVNVNYLIKRAILSLYWDIQYLNTFNDNILNYFKNIGISISNVKSYLTLSEKKNWDKEKKRLLYLIILIKVNLILKNIYYYYYYYKLNLSFY